MGIFDQALTLAQSYIWLPGLVFILVVGTTYWLTQPSHLAVDPPDQDATPVITPKAAEQRGAFRRQGNTVEVYVATPEDKQNPSIASVLDRSVGGLRLAAFQKIEVGAIISVRPTNADGIVPWVDLEVRSCRPSVEMPDRFDVGCQYVKSPPYSIQLLFG